MNMDDEKWHYRFLDIANQVSSWSKDPQRKVGALVISPDGRQVSWGYNGFPKKIPDSSRLLHSEWKNTFMIHAEVNAILNSTQSVAGWTLCSSAWPCHECAKVIIQSGITHVVAPIIPDPTDPPSKWEASWSHAEGLFLEAGIKVSSYDIGTGL